MLHHFVLKWPSQEIKHASLLRFAHVYIPFEEISIGKSKASPCVPVYMHMYSVHIL